MFLSFADSFMPSILQFTIHWQMSYNIIERIIHEHLGKLAMDYSNRATDRNPCNHSHPPKSTSNKSLFDKPDYNQLVVALKSRVPPKSNLIQSLSTSHISSPPFDEIGTGSVGFDGPPCQNCSDPSQNSFIMIKKRKCAIFYVCIMHCSRWCVKMMAVCTPASCHYRFDWHIIRFFIILYHSIKQLLRDE